MALTGFRTADGKKILEQDLHKYDTTLTFEQSISPNIDDWFVLKEKKESKVEAEQKLTDMEMKTEE